MQLELDSLVAFDDGKPLVRALADSGHARVMLVCLRAGQFVRDHRSGSQVIAHFLKGRAIFYADGVPQDAAAGSLVLLEPNRFHRIQAVEDCVVLVTLAPHPAREGYPRAELDRIIPRAGEGS